MFAFKHDKEVSHIAILNDENEPLFVVSEIMTVLQIPDSDTVLQDFESDEKVERNGRVFLTISGIRRLSNTYRSQRGIEFRRWASRKIREMLDQETRQLESKLRARVAKEQLPGTIYVVQNKGDAERNLYKVGRTRDVDKRSINFNTAMPDGSSVVYSAHCVATKACEQWLSHRLAIHHYNREWYQCDLAFIKKAVDDAVSFVNSQMEIAAEESTLHSRSSASVSKPQLVASPTIDPLQRWLLQNIVSAPGKRIHLHRFDKAYGRKLGKHLITQLQALGYELEPVNDKQKDTGCCTSAFRYIRNVTIRNWSDVEQSVI